MSVNQDYANNVSRILEQLGNARAGGSLRQGAILGGYLNDLGRTIELQPERQLRQQEIAAQTADLQSLAQERQFKQQQYGDAQKGQAALVQALQDPANTDPTTGRVDHRKVAQAVGRVSPGAADAYLTQALKHEELWNTLADESSKQEQRSIDAAYRSLKDVNTPEEADAVLALNAHSGSSAITGPVADQLQQALRQGPDALKQFKAHLYSASTEGQEEAKAKRAEAHKITIVPRGGVALEGTTPIAEGQAPAQNEAEIAMQAAGGDPAKAMELLKPPKEQQPGQVGTLADFLTKKYGPNPTPAQVLAGRQAYEATGKSQPVDQIVPVKHKDPTTGRTVIDYLPKSQLAGRTFEAPTNATTENRLASAEAVQQTGNEIIAQLSDPKVIAALGPLRGRYTTVQEFVGNPPPEYSELAGMIESYALANMGVHGMRSAQGAEQIKQLLQAKFSPENIKGAVRGLQKFSEHFMQNEGRSGQVGTTTPKRILYDSNGNPIIK